MKKSRFNEEQIIGILKQSEAGAKTSELCRQHSVSAATFYAWRSEYGGLEVSEAKRLKQLEEENSKLKRIVADHAGSTDPLHRVSCAFTSPSRSWTMANPATAAKRRNSSAPKSPVCPCAPITATMSRP